MHTPGPVTPTLSPSRALTHSPPPSPTYTDRGRCWHRHALTATQSQHSEMGMQRHNLHSDRCSQTHTNPDSLPKGHGNAHTEARSTSTRGDSQIHPLSTPLCSTVHTSLTCARGLLPGTGGQVHSHTDTLSHPVQAWEPMGSGLSTSPQVQPAP